MKDYYNYSFHKKDTLLIMTVIIIIIDTYIQMLSIINHSTRGTTIRTESSLKVVILNEHLHFKYCTGIKE